MIKRFAPSLDPAFRAPTFHQIADVEATDSGEILVLDQATRELSVLDERGGLLGGVGDREMTVGFGELLSQVLIVGPETILVPDIANDRALFFDIASRTMVHEIKLPEQMGFADHWAATSSGQLYVSTAPASIQKLVLEPERISQYLPLLLTPALTINVLSNDSLKPVVKIEDRRSSIPIFSPGIIWDVLTDGRLVIADGPRRLLVYYSPGGEFLQEKSIPLEPSVISASEREWLLKRLCEAHGLGEPPSFISYDVDALGPQFTAMRVDKRDRVWLRRPATIASLEAASMETFPEMLMKGSSHWAGLNSLDSEPLEIAFPNDFELTRIRGVSAYGFRVISSDACVPVRFHLSPP